MDPDVSAESDRREEELAIIWRAQAGPQSALISCPCYEIFFGGARGGGKTDGVLGEFAGHADKYGSLASGLMVRRQRTELVDAIERSKEIYSPLGAKYNETDKLWRFENGARLRFAYLEHDSDADAYQGHNYTRVYIEEAGNFPSSAPIFKLMATLRSANNVPVKMILTGNPGGPGQAWIRERYIDPAPLGYHLIHSEFVDPWTGERVKRERVYIPSRVKDNAYLGPEYIANLQMSGSPQLVRAWLEGDFSAIVGAFFTNFSRCIIPPFTVPVHWTRFRSFDWGSAKPFSVGWWAVADGKPIVYPDGSTFNIRRNELVRYREWYGAKSPNVGLELTDEEIARGILERQVPGEEFAYSVADPSIFSKRKTGTGKSTAEVMAGVGVRFRPADNNRVLGWNQMRGRLTGMDGEPMVRCFSTCVDSIRTIPLLQHDDIRPEDVNCFVAGTKVQTIDGPRPIETIRVGMMVDTPVGYRSVINAGLSGYAKTMTVELSNGMRLEGTRAHKIFVNKRGLVPLYSVATGGILMARNTNPWVPRELFTRALFIAVSAADDIMSRMALISRTAIRRCIGRYGSTITALFPTAAQSTTSIMTPITMIYPISNVWRNEATPYFITGRDKQNCSDGWRGGALHLTAEKRLRPTQQRCARTPHNVSLRALIVNDLLSHNIKRRSIVLKNVSRLRTYPRWFLNVLCVVSALLKGATGKHKHKPVRIIAVGSCGEEMRPVYNLTVDEAHLYYANNVLVSNSDGEDHAGDEWRYMCLSRPWASDPKVRPVKDIRSLTLDDAWKLTGPKRSARL